MEENTSILNTGFTDREGSHLNRRKLTIISQTPKEIIVDVERADDNITETGTKINASNLQNIITKINDLESKIDQESGSYIYVDQQFENEINFTSDPQTQLDNKLNKTDILDTIYPVGSIYMSVSTTSPTILFGGQWEQINGKFLLSSSNEYALLSTGGNATHTLSIDEMPEHTHLQEAHTHTQSSHNHGLWSARQYQNNADGLGMNSSDGNIAYNKGNTLYIAGAWNGTTRGNSERYYFSNNLDNQYVSSCAPEIQNCTAINKTEGKGLPHNNMPPYLVVNMWKRIS